MNIVRDLQFPKNPEKIKVLAGVYRSGKTTFLTQKMQELAASGVEPSDILYINIEEDPSLKEAPFVFLDGIESLPDWAAKVLELHDTKRAEIFLAGSSAKMASRLRSRAATTEIFPYSFSEYMRAKNIKKPSEQAFKTYLVEGGFPEVVHYSEGLKDEKLQEYVQNALYRDVTERCHINNPPLIKHMILALYNCYSAALSTEELFNDMKSRGYRVGRDLLEEYLDCVEESYLAFRVSHYGPSVRKAKTDPKKIYLPDTGLVRAFGLGEHKDFPKLFENFVYLELRKKGYQLHYYVTKEHYEVDFVATPPKGPAKMFQVLWDQNNNRLYERKMRALELAEEALGLTGEMIIPSQFYLS